MVALSTVRNLAIVATETGVEETTAKLNALAGAQGGVAVAATREEKALISVDRQLDRLRRTTDVVYRDQQQLARGTDVLSRALASGRITVAEHARQVDLLAAKYRNADTAQAGLLAGSGRLRSLAMGFGVGSVLGYLTDPIALAGRIRDTVSAVDDLGDAAERAAVSGATLQVFRYQLEQGAGAAEDADRALEKFRKGVGELALAGKGPAKDALAALRIEIRDTNGALKSQEQLLDEVLRQFPRVKDEATQLAIAVRLFGKEAGPAMAVELAKGNAAIDQAREKMEGLGVLMSEDMIDAADKFDKRFNDLSMSFAARMRDIVFWALWALDQGSRLEEHGGIVPDAARRQMRLWGGDEEGGTTTIPKRPPQLPAPDQSPLADEEALSDARRRAMEDLRELLMLRKQEREERRRAADAAATERDSIDDVFDSYRRETEGLVETNAARGESRETILRLTEVRKLENELLSRQIELTPALVKRINEEADARVDASLATEQQARNQERWAALAGFGRDTFKSIADIARDGKITTDEWTEALGRFGDRLWEIGSNALLDIIFGGGTGGGAGGLIGMLFGGGAPATRGGGGGAAPLARARGRAPALGSSVVNYRSGNINVAGSVDAGALAALRSDMDRRDRRIREELPELIRRGRQDGVL